MNFDDAVKQILSDGYLLKRIRKQKRSLNYSTIEGIEYSEVAIVLETAKNVAVIRNLEDNLEGKADIFRYKLDEELPLKDNEFWTPCVMDGCDGWIRYSCAPDWITDQYEQLEFCKKHFGKSRKHNEGEWSTEPLTFISMEKGNLRAFDKAPMFTPDKDRARLEANLGKYQSVALSYMSYAQEIALKLSPPQYRVSYKNLMGESDGSSECPVSYHPPELARIIELAYRAGRAAEKSAFYYRNIPRIAEEGEALVRGRGEKGGSKKKWREVAKELIRELLCNGEKVNPMQIAEQLKKESLCDFEGWGKETEIDFYEDKPDDLEKDDYKPKLMKQANFRSAISSMKSDIEKSLT